jgi:(1->4)-alpha-D-glucan 1-alpha-D-glucosylmutase
MGRPGAIAAAAVVRVLEHRMIPAIPVATYRLQLSSAFGFDDAAKLVPYLKSLGISHLYASPFLKARAGSTHGYDIIDHGQLNPEFGGEPAFARLSAALAMADMGLILDFVPNHMGIGGADNTWWLDVLEWGPKSPHAASFDIEWETLPYRREGGVLLPILGRSYGDALESEEIVLRYDAEQGSFSAWYYEHRLPIRPDRYGEMLRTIVAAAGAGEEPAGRQLLGLAARHGHPRAPSREQAPAFKAALAAVPGGADVIERGIGIYRPTAGAHASAGPLHRLLERQHYRLAHWRVAGSEINYRRFFDINSLAGLRVEDPKTFRAVHELVARLIAENRLQGLRLDHIDGLRDPLQYCRRLQRLIRQMQSHTGRRPFYVVVEKILADGEAMPRLAGVAGTTGYEWVNVISRLLVHDEGLDPLDRLRKEITDNPRSFRQILERAKLRVLDNMLASEFTVLTRLLARIAAGHYSTRDYTIDRLRAALQFFVLEFPVYRTYVTASGPSTEDRATINRAIGAARARWYGSDTDIFDFLRDTLTLDLTAPSRVGYSSARVRSFALKVQQFTGPMMAKSLEDTAFYRYFRLLALNEVGGDPPAPGLSIAEFHRRMDAHTVNFPHGLTATATHDTKRGEDARTRVLAISELAEDWSRAVSSWHEINDHLAGRADGARAPSLGHEYMLYQTLVGAWPLGGVNASLVARLQEYALKAAREGKVETSWINPNEVYESALTRFVHSILDPAQSASFLESFSAMARRIALLGALNSLSQLALKATMPGIPDFYQGTELWDLSLVDPDNRRPVDFTARMKAFDAIGDRPDWPLLADSWHDGRIKLALTRRLLALRTELRTVFRDGVYQPLGLKGPHRDHVVAFARASGRDAAIVVAGRHFAAFTDGGCRWPSADAWDASVMFDGFSAPRNWLMPEKSVSGHEMPVAALFDIVPVAVLRATPQRAVSARPRAPSAQVVAG